MRTRTSTAAALACVALAALAGPAVSGAGASSVAAHEMRQTVPLAPGVGYGLGIIRVASPCGAVWGHDGSFAGYLSDTLSSAGGRHQMVLLFNQNTFDDTAGTPAAQKAAARLIQTAACARL